MSMRVSIGQVRDNARSSKRPFRLEWTIFANGRKYAKTKTWHDRFELDRFRIALEEAARSDAATWNLETGLPNGVNYPGTGGAHVVAPSGPLALDVIADMHRRWESLTAGNRKSQLDSYSAVLVAAVTEDAPELTPSQKSALREAVRRGLTPMQNRQRADEQKAADAAARRAANDNPSAAALRRRAANDNRAKQRAAQQAEQDRQWFAYLQRYGLRWDQLDMAAVVRIQDACRKNMDGARAAAATLAHRAVALNSIINDAVRARRMAADPRDMLPDRERLSTTVTVRPCGQHEVLSPATVEALLQTIEQMSSDPHSDERRAVPYFRLLANGLRPAEGRHRRFSDARVDDRDGHGSLNVPEVLAEYAAAVTDDGKTTVVKGPKTGSRSCMLRPSTARALAQRRMEANLGADDFVTADADGTPLTSAQLLDVWHRALTVAREQGLNIPADLDPYALRHSFATALMSTKELDDAVVATWLGHSIATLQSTYHGVVSAGIQIGKELDRVRNDLVPPAFRRAAMEPPRPAVPATCHGRATRTPARAGRRGR